MLTGPSFTPKDPKQVLILLHGYGADGNDLFSLTEYLKNYFPQMAFFAPNAPHETSFLGYQWFSLDDYFSRTSLDISYLTELQERALKVVPQIEEYISKIENDLNITRENIFIAGFSQGGLMAGQTAFQSKQPFKGLALMSPVPMANISSETKKIPVLVTRGLQDEVIPPQIAELTTPILKEHGFKVKESIDPFVAHGISQIHLNTLIQFIKENI